MEINGRYGTRIIQVQSKKTKTIFLLKKQEIAIFSADG
jgi:hypothetical protein